MLGTLNCFQGSMSTMEHKFLPGDYITLKYYSWFGHGIILSFVPSTLGVDKLRVLWSDGRMEVISTTWDVKVILRV